MLYVGWYFLSYLNVQLVFMDVTVACWDVRLMTVVEKAMAGHSTHRSVF